MRLFDARWAGETLKGARIYGLDAWHLGFLLIAVWSVASCILISFTSETHCKQSA